MNENDIITDGNAQFKVRKLNKVQSVNNTFADDKGNIDITDSVKSIKVNNAVNADNFGSIIRIVKNMTFSAANTFYNTGIKGEDIPSGVYILHFYCNNGSISQQLWSEHFTGLLYWYNGGTNSSNSTNIYIHFSGHANNSCTITARTLRQPNGGRLQLQLCSTIALENADWTFEFKRMI